MRKRSLLAFASIFLLLISACQRTTYSPGVSSESPSIKKEILDNGLTVLVKEEHAHPVVTIIASVDAGLSAEGKYCGTGISHFLEHMAFKGTYKRGPGEIEEEVKSYGGVINASTSLDNTTYYITVPKEFTGGALSLMQDILFHPVLDTEELEKEREVILKEIKLNNDDPSRRVGRKMWQTAYVKHPYGKPIIGFEENFKELKREDLVQYQESRHIPGNIILTLVGDVEEEKALRQVKSIFGMDSRFRGNDSKPSPRPGREASRTRGVPDAEPVKVPHEPEQNKFRKNIERFPINLAYLSMGYHTVELASDDLYALDVLALILGGWDGSRLQRKLVKENQLLYSVSSYNYTPKYPGLFIVYGIGDYKKIADAKQKISETIGLLAIKGVSNVELNTAKNIVSSDYIDSLETTQGLARAISQSEYLAKDPAFFEKYVESVKVVTNRDIIRVARKYLRTDNLTVSILHPEYAEVDVDEAAETGSKRSGGFVDRFADRVGRHKCRPTRSAKRSVCVPATSTKPHVPQKFTLPNGIRLILKEDHRLPKVSIVCAFLGGLRVENAENNGVSNLTSTMLLKGTKRRNESQIVPFIESQGGAISHFSGRNTFGISMRFLSEKSKNALDVLADALKNPAFPEDEIRKQKEKLYAAIKGQDDDIYNVGFIKLRKALFRNHPYGLRVIGEKSSLEKITRSDLKNYHNRFCVPSNMAISCVGDFDSRKMRKEIEKRLRMPSNSALTIEVEKALPLAGETKVDYTMPREESLVAVGFQGTTFANPERFSLSLLSSILSGENGRLYKEIRNKSGLAYTLGTFSVPGIDSGLLTSYVGTDREHVEETKKILLRELDNIKEGSLTEKELRLAKSSLVGRHKISLQSNSTLVYRMALDELYGIGYGYYLDYQKHIEGVTMGDIDRVADKYMDSEKSVLVTILGE